MKTNWNKKVCFYFCFYFYFYLFRFRRLYSLISELGAAGVVVVEAKVFFHVVPAHVVPAWIGGCRGRGGRGFPNWICKCVVKYLRRTINFPATAAANAILIFFCWCGCRCRCKRRTSECVGWNRCWRRAVGFESCFSANFFLLDILFLRVRKNNPIRRVWIHDARFTLWLNPFAKVLGNDAGNPEVNVHNCKTEVCIRVLEFHKINTQNNCNLLAFKNAHHIWLVHLIAVDSGNVESSSKRVWSGCGCQLWLCGHIELVVVLLMSSGWNW